MRYHKEVWKYKFKLIFNSIQLSEMHGMGRVKINDQTFLQTIQIQWIKFRTAMFVDEKKKSQDLEWKVVVQKITFLTRKTYIVYGLKIIPNKVEELSLGNVRKQLWKQIFCHSRSTMELHRLRWVNYIHIWIALEEFFPL